MVCLCLDLSLLLKAVNNVLVTPTDFMGKTLVMKSAKFRRRIFHTKTIGGRPYLNSAVLAARLQPQHAKRIRNDHLLLTVVWRRNTLEELETLYRGCATSSLVGQHATHGLEEDAGWRTVMERPRLFGVDDVALVQEVVVPQLLIIMKSL